MTPELLSLPSFSEMKADHGSDVRARRIRTRRSVRRAYTEDQPRDDHGRWTSGSGEISDRGDANGEKVDQHFNERVPTQSVRAEIKAGIARDLGDRMRAAGIDPAYMNGTALHVDSANFNGGHLAGAFDALAGSHNIDAAREMIDGANREQYGKLLDLSYQYSHMEPIEQQGIDQRIAEAEHNNGNNLDLILAHISDELRATGHDGLDEYRGYAASFVSRWMESAGDTSAPSIAMQINAANVFGGDTSYFTGGAPGVFMDRSEEAGKDFGHTPQEIAADERPLAEAFYNASRDSTQEMLRGLGIGPNDPITVYRGVGSASPTHAPLSPMDAVMGRGTGARETPIDGVRLNPVSSWTTSQSTAATFGGGPIIRTTVPASSFVGSALTGQGAIIEQELIMAAPEGGVAGADYRQAAASVPSSWPYVDEPPFDDWIKTKRSLDEALFPTRAQQRRARTDRVNPPRRAYSEDQPRDDHGRFTSGGGGGDKANDRQKAEAARQVSATLAKLDSQIVGHTTQIGDKDLEANHWRNDHQWGITEKPTDRDGSFAMAEQAEAAFTNAGYDGAAVGVVLGNWISGLDQITEPRPEFEKDDPRSIGANQFMDFAAHNVMTEDLTRGATLLPQRAEELHVGQKLDALTPGRAGESETSRPSSWTLDPKVANVFANYDRESRFGDPSKVPVILHTDGPVHGAIVSPFATGGGVVPSYSWQHEAIVIDPQMTVTRIERGTEADPTTHVWLKAS